MQHFGGVDPSGHCYNAWWANPVTTASRSRECEVGSKIVREVIAAATVDWDQVDMAIHLNGMNYQRPFEFAPGSHGLYIILAKSCGNAGLVSTPQLYRSLLAKNPEDR